MQTFFTNAIKLAALSLTILFMNFSCQDHEVPQLLPVLETIPVTQSRKSPPPYLTFYINHYRVNIKEKGNVPVAEYGVLYSTYHPSELENNASYVIKQPTVLNSPPHVITQEFEIGERLMSNDGDNFPLRTYVYQRAYAKLTDGRVVYGDVILTQSGRSIPLM
ncbi:hypothetical protein [Dyadobacter psychrotolerans]|uniref:LPS export ABC transporter periplasmic protein LptC n=1 Tax=Dyadobacter psychrotolerans TaxID=2541721 RepID=A0A4R5DVE5_9BACT|nr:hypothetical protein [Dyadobacter psychrotolerans]TDE16514.1 hypothetical protein E0F88_09765 [Dyadobacter psychrotolerans]